jgi:hypothetical protein
VGYVLCTQTHKFSTQCFEVWKGYFECATPVLVTRGMTTSKAGFELWDLLAYSGISVSNLFLLKRPVTFLIGQRD